jgi:hypothetical protein
LLIKNNFKKLYNQFKINLMKKRILPIYLLLLVISFFIGIENSSAQSSVLVSNDGGYLTPNATSVLDIYSTTDGLLIPRMTLVQKTAIVAPATGLLVFQTNGTPPGFYYYTGTEWQLLYAGDVPTVPGETEYWLRPTATPTYIYPEGNVNIRVYDAAQTYGVWYDGTATQYAFYARTANTTFDPTVAVTGFSDIVGQQQYGYLGYNGSITVGGSTVNGAAVYGLTDDPLSIGVYGRTTALASVAAIVGYSNVWMASYNYVDNASATSNPSANYSQLNVTSSTLASDNKAVVGLCMYENTTADGTGTSVGGLFAGYGDNTAVTFSQNAIGVAAESTSILGVGTATGVLASSNSGAYEHPNGYGSGIACTGFGGGLYADLDNSTNAGLGYYSGQAWSGALCDAWPNFGANTQAYFYGVHGTLVDQTAGSTARRSAGVLGSHEDADTYNAWGALGYVRSNNPTTYYGVYGSTAYMNGVGKDIIVSNTAVAGSGSLFGAWFDGEIYGMAVSGERYSLYVDGKQFTNDIIAQMNDNGTEERFATYVPTSMSVDVYMKGTGKLIDGKATIKFDDDYLSLISETEPVFVTVTPMGKSDGVYLEEVKSTGFSVAENGDSKSTVEFTWIAVATRKGYENPETPVELVSTKYDENLAGYMFNESNTEENGLPMWWDGTKIRFDEVQFDETPVLITKKRLLKGETLLSKMELENTSKNYIDKRNELIQSVKKEE